jgi:HK97 family phage prohead protease
MTDHITSTPRSTFVSDDLLRSVDFELRADDDNDGLTLEGYAAVFGQATRINSWEGCFDETIARGAFKKSIRERKPVVQFDHGRHPMVGSIPLGSIDDLREDDAGLFVSARLHDNWLVQPVRDAIKSKTVSGMSFRFGVVKDEWRDAAGKLVKPEDVQRLLWAADPEDPSTILQRTLKEVRCAELGPVVFPAYAGTSVSVRSQELAALLTDPQVRAEAARLLIGTPPEDMQPAPADDEGRAASKTEEPLVEHSTTVRITPPEARARALALETTETPHG